MIKTIVRDLFFLGQKSEETTRKDGQVIQDLQDTLAAHREGCLFQGTEAELQWFHRPDHPARNGSFRWHYYMNKTVRRSGRNGNGFEES